MEEVHHFHQRLFCLILPGHIGKGLAGLGLHIDLGVGLAEGHGVARKIAHPFGEHPAEQLPDADKDHNGQHPAQQRRKEGIGLGGDLRGKGDVFIAPQLFQQPLSVVRPDAGLIDLDLPLFIMGGKDDILVGLAQRHFFYLSGVHHVQKITVCHLVDLPLQHRREEKRVEQHQHDQRHHIVKNQRFFGGRRLLFCPFFPHFQSHPFQNLLKSFLCKTILARSIPPVNGTMENLYSSFITVPIL